MLIMPMLIRIFSSCDESQLNLQDNSTAESCTLTAGHMRKLLKQTQEFPATVRNLPGRK